MRRMTSICHCKNANYQVDHQDANSFESWCLKNAVLWGRLFDESTGELLATYTSGAGVSAPSEPQRNLFHCQHTRVIQIDAHDGYLCYHHEQRTCQDCGLTEISFFGQYKTDPRKAEYVKRIAVSSNRSQTHG